MISKKTKKKAVLLLQMGGPCCPEAIENFLFNLFNDKYIIQLPGFLTPFQKNLAEFISKRRAPKVAVNYRMIGGRSPILFETQCQAKALEKKLGSEYQCFIAMRYSYPFLKDTIKEIHSEDFSELTVIPLYPQYSTATSGSSIIECKESFSQSGLDQKIKINYIESWHDNQAFIELITLRLKDKIEELQILFKRKELEIQRAREAGATGTSYFSHKIHILFSAHGLPVKYIKKGDPYQNQVEDSVNLIIQNLAEKIKLKSYKQNLKSDSLDLEWQITYQSRVGPVKWLEPNTENVIEDLGRTGAKNLIIVPISFVGDHIETLHELGIEYQEVAYEHGIDNYLVTRLPKANPLLIDALYSSLNLNQAQNTATKSGLSKSVIARKDLRES
jgi:protoporphyrin/coproporphyrin ferrochelatase